jgi:hypothetical protein
MNKYEIYPKVMLYQNVIENVDEIYNIIKQSHNKNSLLKWRKWEPMGLIASSHQDLIKENDITSEQNTKEKEAIDHLYSVYSKLFDDYAKDWSTVGHWPSYIGKWDLSKWNISEISFLKHEPHPEWHMSMNYHTDTHSWSQDARANNFIATVTMYLNDNYAGGEISFLDESTNNLIKYKPKAGDVTIFPSGHPYFHGVYSAKDNDRYAVRMFYMHNYEGSEDWLKNEKLYGQDLWEEMEKERADKEFNSGKWHRYVCLPGEIPDRNQTAVIVNINKEIIFETPDKEKSKNE